jgi:hypothetical protein
MKDKEGLIPKPEDRLFCVKVGKIQRENLYEMARKYWKASLMKASKATHVLAVKEGKVIAVYNPIEWKYTENARYEGRIEFVGTEIPDSEYIGKDVQAYYGFSANPIKYINF